MMRRVFLVAKYRDSITETLLRLERSIQGVHQIGNRRDGSWILFRTEV